MSKRLLVLLVLLLLAPTLVHAKVFLVSVGISDYPGTKNDLNLPARDAQTITWLYSKNSDLVYTQLLNEKATKKRILAAMVRVFSQAGPDDVVLFFYSGHGYQGGFCGYDANFSYSEVRNAMSKSKSRNKMIFADACFSGKIRVGGNVSQSEVNDVKKSNIMLFLSSRSNETSFERRGMQNGFFTTYLQSGLRGGADANRDKRITAKELFTYVHTKVSSVSEGKQHPVMWGSFSDNMVIMKW